MNSWKCVRRVRRARCGGNVEWNKSISIVFPRPTPPCKYTPWEGVDILDSGWFDDDDDVHQGNDDMGAVVMLLAIGIGTRPRAARVTLVMTAVDAAASS